MYLDGICTAIAMPQLCLTLIVFLSSPLGTTPSTRIYYIMIAMCELMTGIFRNILLLFVGFGLAGIASSVVTFEIEFVSAAACQSVDFICFFFEMVSNHAYVALAIERIIALFFPLVPIPLISRNPASIYMAILCACSFLLCSCIIAGADVFQTDKYGLSAICYIVFAGNSAVGWVAVLMIFLRGPSRLHSA